MEHDKATLEATHIGAVDLTSELRDGNDGAQLDFKSDVPGYAR